MRHWAALPLERIFAAQEEMGELAAALGHAAGPESAGGSETWATSVDETSAGYRRDRSGNELVLTGCTPVPLASYLKALGILRLVAEQADSSVRVSWRADQLVLHSSLDAGGLRNFLLWKYRPTPIISPWNGRAGFLEGEEASESQRKGAVIVRNLIASRGSRLSGYRSVLCQIRDLPAITELNAVRAQVKRLEKAKKAERLHDPEELKAAKAKEKYLKNQLLVRLRSELGDDFLQWIDACLALTDEDSATAPLLGSGGNEGSMDYSVNHLVALDQLIDRQTDEPTTAALSSIDEALFGNASVIETHANPGFLSPYGVGGANMSTGYNGEVTENAWNVVLMLEGALLFAASTTRRLQDQGSAYLSFPFVMEAVRSGHGGVSIAESARSELWAPIWPDPLSLTELRSMLSEARATVGRRRAKNGLDMARSLAGLGVDRGIQSFQRYGFFERRGQGYYVAALLERREVRRSTATDLLNDLDTGYWLEKFRGLARKKNASQTEKSLVRRLEDQIFQLTASGNPAADLERLLMLLGDIELYLARSREARKACHPVPMLSPAWLTAADDGSPEMALAAALAGLHARGHGDRDWRLPMRAHLSPIRPGSRLAWDAEAERDVLWQPNSNLSDNLAAALHRRLLVAERAELPDKPLRAARRAGLADIADWLAGGIDEARLAALLPGLMLVRLPAGTSPRGEREAPLPAAYRLLKPLFATDEQLHRAGLLPAGRSLPLPAAIVRRLETGDVAGAVEHAERRLRAAGIRVAQARVGTAGIDGRQLLAALTVPIGNKALASLLPQALRPKTESEDRTTSIQEQ
jgi:CRISPR-associated protein Csx17